MRLLIIFLVAFFVTTTAADSQEEHASSLVLIETIDGNEFIGRIVLEDDEKIIFLTEAFGEITIRKDKVKKRRIIE